MARRIILAITALVLAALVVPVANAGGGGFCHETSTTQGTTTTVDMKGSCFTPTVTTVDVGDAVKWSNGDSYDHVIVGAGGSWRTNVVVHRDAAAIRFDSPGVYPYFCEFHPGMIGTVVVGDGKAGTKTAGSGPVAVPVSDESDPPAGSGTAPVTDEAPRTTPASSASSDGMSALAVVAIAILAGVLGYGAAHLLNRRNLALLATKKLG